MGHDIHGLAFLRLFNLDEFELKFHAVMDFSLNMAWGLFYMEESNVNEEKKAMGFSTSVKSM
jgi:hypothetical protein